MESIIQAEVDRLKGEAAKHRERAAESWERSDTDGFLSQWASGLSARLAETQAKILEDDGAEFWGLVDLSGNRVCAKLIDGKFGLCWAFMDQPGGKFVGRFVPFCEAAGEVERIECGDECHNVAGDTPGSWVVDAKATAKALERARKRLASWEKRHGLRQVREWAPAMAKIIGKGTGLSGSAWVAVFRTDGL